MANPILKIKRGSGAPPSTLEAGQQAYDLTNKVLYQGNGTTNDKIAGPGAVVMLEGNQTVAGTKTFSSTISGDISGNSATSTKLATSRTLSVSGDATGSQSFDGSGNADIALTLANSGVSAGTFTKLTVNAKGLATSGTTLEAADIPSLTASKISDFDSQVRTSRLDQMAAPTASVSLNSQKITNLADPSSASDAANKGYIDSAITNLVNGSPSTLDTLNELATALGSDANFSTTVTNLIGEKLAKASNLSDLTDASAARSNLGLVIGTNVQAYDAELSAIAGLTSAADKVPYFTGSGTAAVADFSSFGRSLVDDSSASDARTTLGLSSMATQTSSNVSITGGAISNVTFSDVTLDGGTY